MKLKFHQCQSHNDGNLFGYWGKLRKLKRILIPVTIFYFSLLPSLIGHMSLKKDRLSLMKVYFYGSILFPLATCICTMFVNGKHFAEYLETKKTGSHVYGIPTIIIWYFYLAISIQVHLFGIYHSRRLIKLWSTVSGKKVRQFKLIKFQNHIN